jgi:ribose-phosphate pyrophosphokinase
MKGAGELKVFAGRSHPDLAKAICQHLGIEWGQISFTDFPNNNIKVKIEENVRECDVFAIQTAAPDGLHDHLMELLIMIDALKYASAKRITAVIPYYFYVRSDKKDEPRISITARLVADLLEAAGANRILTMSLHAPQTMGFARIPVDQLDGTQILCEALAKKDLKDFVAVAPDMGRAKLTEHYAKRLGLPVAVLGKRRIEEGKPPVIRYLIGDVQGKNVLFLDDEILTGSTILEGIRFLKDKGAERFLAACVHGVLGDDAVSKIEGSELEKLWVTDTLPPKESPKIKVCSVAELFAEAIKRIHTGGSVSALFH